jgi:hypothetical protein
MYDFSVRQPRFSQPMYSLSIRSPPFTQGQRVPLNSGLAGSRNTSGSDRSASFPVSGFQ